MGRQIYAERQRHSRREDLPAPDEPVIPERHTRERGREIGEKLLDLLAEVDIALYDNEYGAGPDPEDTEPDDELEPAAV